MSYDTTTQTSYTQETVRLQPYDPAPMIWQPPRGTVPQWAIFAAIVLLGILMLARMPEPPPPAAYPAIDRHVEIFSRNCIGYCP